MSRIGRIEDFKRFFIGLIQGKRSEVPQEVASSLQKNMEQNRLSYKNTGKPIRISYVAPDGKMIILADGSQWAAASAFGLDQSHALIWSPSERVMVMERGNELGNVFTIRNLDMGENSRWIFQGYTEETTLTSSDEEYPNLGVVIPIKKVSGELIWLQDDSKWHMYNQALQDPGPWDRGHLVIVSRGVMENRQKRNLYQMENQSTKQLLMAIFMEYDK